ncbi:MAG: hypothetical protein RLZZ214_3226, partial [Verrucomicrobiota bacterium]
SPQKTPTTNQNSHKGWIKEWGHSTLTPTQVEKLRAALERQGFDFESKPYAVFSARKGKLNVTVYEKGPKMIMGQSFNQSLFLPFRPRPSNSPP